MSECVLLVEDDHTLRSLLRLLFEENDFRVVEAADGVEALERFREFDPAIVILDLRLPGMSGFDVCRELRRHSAVPIIIVSAQSDTPDIVAGLELGADDYVTKPYNDHELLARVRVQLRSHRDQTEASERVVVEDLEIAPSEGEVFKAGERVHLTRTEFLLLCQFAAHRGQVLSRPQLLESVWEYPPDGDTRLVDTHIGRLRAKIESSPAEPTLLVTVRGLGYKLVR